MLHPKPKCGSKKTCFESVLRLRKFEQNIENNNKQDLCLNKTGLQPVSMTCGIVLRGGSASPSGGFPSGVPALLLRVEIYKQTPQA